VGAEVIHPASLMQRSKFAMLSAVGSTAVVFA
jgi:hypothetical protein